MTRAITLATLSLALTLSVAHAQSRDTENSNAAPVLADGERGVETPVPAGNILKDGNRGVETPVGGYKEDVDSVPGVDNVDTQRVERVTN